MGALRLVQIVWDGDQGPEGQGGLPKGRNT